MYVEWVTMYEEAVAKLTTQVYTVICRHIIYMSYNFTGFVEQLDSQRAFLLVFLHLCKPLIHLSDVSSVTVEFLFITAKLITHHFNCQMNSSSFFQYKYIFAIHSHHTTHTQVGKVNIKVIHGKALHHIIPLLRGMPILTIFFGKIGRKNCRLFPKVTEKKC